ncbi:cytochrome P450 [Cladorrhinum sp. PSN332]|nr:cytochrome P450 [Cladorrhinum sp. PSN332]
MADNNPGNFANRPKEEVQAIASKGGQASHSGGFASMDPDKQREIASKGGKASSGSFEPGSEKAREAGRKGGLASGGGTSDEGNWGFLAFTDHNKLERYQELVTKYLEKREEGSLVSRLPKNKDNIDLASQVAQWLFAFDAAAMATYRALALLAAHPKEQDTAFQEAKLEAGVDRPFTRGAFLESLRLWPTTPAILQELTEDHQIGGKLIKKGTGVVIFTPFFHRDNEKLPFANKLSPDRWKDEEVIIEKGSVPFSSGPTICPAHNLVPMVASLVMDGGLKGAKIRLIRPELDVENLPGTLNKFEVELNLSVRN